MRRSWWLIAVVLCWLAIWRVWPVVGLRTTSFGGYWAVGQAWWSGVEVAWLYDEAFFADWLRSRSFLLPERMLGPPPLVLTLVPLAWLPYATARGIWLWAVLLPALAAGTSLAARRAGGPLLAAAFLISPGVALGLEVGQVYPLYLLLHLGALASLGRPWAFGASVAPMLLTRGWLGAPLLAVMALAGRWRLVLAGVGGFVLLALATLPLVGVQSWLAFVEQLQRAVTPGREMVTAYQSLPSLAAHLTMSHPHWGPDPPLPLPGVRAAVVALGWLGMAVLAWMSRRDVTRLFAVGVIVELLMSPFTQDYQMILAIVPAAVALERGQRGLAWLGVALLVAPVPFDWTGLWGGWRSMLAYPRVWGLLALAAALAPYLSVAASSRTRRSS